MKTVNCGGDIGDGYPWELFTSPTKDANQQNILIFPNPVSSVLSLNLNKNLNFQYQIYDINGRRNQHETLTNNAIDVSQISQGAYILFLDKHETNVAIKFIKTED